jgi:hypothetical protein
MPAQAGIQESSGARRKAKAQGSLRRTPDYADQHGQTGLGGGDRREGSGIIRALAAVFDGSSVG